MDVNDERDFEEEAENASTLAEEEAEAIRQEWIDLTTHTYEHLGYPTLEARSKAEADWDEMQTQQWTDAVGEF